jgi:DNA-directed RNA polymerase specialized sigma24 family protein
MYKEVDELMEKNFGMNLKEFDSLCSNLLKGDNTLFEKIYLSHFSECQHYLCKQHKISMEASYDLTMDTLISFRKGLIAGKIQYGNLRFLFTRMAYYLHLKKQKNLNLLDKEEYQYLQSILDKENSAIKESKLNQIQKAVQQLSEDKQKFIEQHFFKKMKLVDIAAQNGQTGPSTRKKKQRILAEIKSILNLNTNNG